MPTETIDTLELSIKTRANQAAKKVEDLASSIESFGKNVAKYVNDMNSFGSAMEKIANSATALSKIKNLGNVIRSATQKSAMGKANIAKAVETAKVAKQQIATQTGKPSTRYLPASGPWSVGKPGKVFNPATGKYETPGAPVPVPVEKVKRETNVDRSWTRNIFAPWTVGRDGKTFNPATGTFEQAKQASETIKENMNKATFAPTDNIANAAQHARELAENARSSAAEFMQTVSEADILQMKLDSVGQALGEALDSKDNDPGKVARLADQYEKLSQKIENVAKAAKEAEKESNNLKNILKAAGSTVGNSFIGKLGGQLYRVAKMRWLRAIVKELAAGFKEGADNLYKWSSGIGGHFAGAMDTLASKAMFAKNSIATAFAPAIEALTPLISTAVGWINSLSNAFSQLVSLLTGKNTWTAAVETAENWGGAVKGAGGAVRSAAKDMKDLLADWDELNIIQSETGSAGGGGGGGSGNTASDYANMFKEMDVFDDWTKYLDEIKAAVLAISIGIAGWFAIDAVGNFLKQLGIAEDTISTVSADLKKGLTGAVLLTVSWTLASAAGKSIANEGLNIKNIGATIGSMIAGALGGHFFGGFVGKMFGGAVAGAKGGVIGAIAGVSIAAVIELYSYLKTKDENAYKVAEKWVRANAFEYDIDAHLNLVNLTVESAVDARKKVRESLSSLNIPMKMIRLGINDNETLLQFKTQLGDENSGLIHDLNEQAGAEKNLIKLFYTMNPKTDNQGNDITATSYMQESKAWDAITEWYTNKGAELGRLFVENEEGQIEISDVEMAKKIIDQVESATSIAEHYLQQSEFSVELDLALTTSEDTKIVEAFENYKEKIREATENTYKQRLQGAEDKVSLMRGIYEAETDERKKSEYKKQLDEAMDVVRELTAPGAMADWIEKNVAKDTKYGEDKVKEYFSDKYVQNMMDQWLKPNFSGERWSQQEIDENFDAEYTVDDALNKWLENSIEMAPVMIADWLKEHADLKPEDFMTDEQKAVVEDIRNRTKLEAPVPENATGVTEVTEAVTELTEELDNTWGTAQGLGDVFSGLQEIFDKDGMLGLAETFENMELGNLEYIADTLKADNLALDVADLAQAILDRRYSEENGLTGVSGGGGSPNTSWFDMEFNVQESGMALDSSVLNMEDTVMNGINGIDQILESLLATMNSVDRNTSATADYSRITANKDFTVNISPSSSFGDVVSRSINRWGNITGG